MNWPQAGGQRAQLDAFDAALLDEGNRVLEIVVRILRAIEGENSARQHGFAIDGFDDPQFVRADFDQRHFAHHALKRILDQVQARLQHFSLNAHFAFSRHHASRWHAAPDIASFLDRNFSRPDVNEDAPQNDEQHDQKNDHNYHYGEN